jgi:radical SAM superfamily enzyme YgiQ (UPF0313 family)
MEIYFIYLPKPYLMNPNAQVGLGALCLATYAKELGADVAIINAQDKGKDWRGDEIPDGSIVCVSACYVDTPELESVGAALRKRNCKVIVGGPIGESMDNVPDCSYDTIVQGVGEPVIEKICNGEVLPSKYYVDQNIILDFERYPMPDRMLLGGNYGGNIFHKNTNLAVSMSTTLLTSRGCKYGCAFCSSGSDKCVYEYSMERVEAEIDQIKSMGIDSIRVSDDNILLDLDRLDILCRLLSKYDMKWRASLRTKPNDIEIFKMLKSNGCMELSFGIESGDDNVLEILNKGASVADNTAAVRNALDAGIENVRALMMMCTPGETSKTYDLNKKWIDMFPEITICLCSFYPFPGTKVHMFPERYGCVIEELDNPNIYSFRADGSSPESHISIVDGMSKPELTDQFFRMIRYLDSEDRINKG